MKIKQLSIFLQNRMGSLSKPLEVLTVANVNIRAMCMADTSEFGILRLVVDDPEKGKEALEENNFLVKITEIIGVEMNDYRIELAKKLGLVDNVFKPGDDTLEKIIECTGGRGVEKSIDCSASDPGRQLAIRAAHDYGKIAFVGEGGTCNFNPSPDIIHGQKTIYGSWVTSLWRMEELVDRLVRWGIHPDELITHECSIDETGQAYRLMASGQCGKVAVVFGDQDEK